MPEEVDHRKLAAILCADVKGYSKLMGEDESYTVAALKECRKLFAENIQNHGGRVVNAPGDSILANNFRRSFRAPTVYDSSSPISLL